MEDFNALLAYHYGKKDVKTLPESLTEDEKLDLIHLLKLPLAQGNSCTAALLDYLEALQLIKSYPLKNQG